MLLQKKLLPFLLLCVACLITLKANAQNYPIVYQLKTYYSTSLTMRIEVVTQHLGKFIITPSRWWIGDNRPKKNIYCADNGNIVQYYRPTTCSLVFWEVSFFRQPMEGLGGRSKGDYFFNNSQWLLKESNNFPRFKDFPNALVCINAKNCTPLPANNPTGEQLFLVWGKQPTVVRTNNLTFEFFTDRLAENFDKQALVNEILPFLNYLNTLFNYSQKNTIKIVMLAKNDGAFKDAGGTAGGNAFLANYYVNNGKPITYWKQRFIELFLHEYIHIITPCNTYPRWACESLADYYAYKAVSNGQVNTRALTQWNKFKNTKADYRLGLYDINQRYQQTKNWAFYSLFYIKGASFWNELDLLLHQKNQNLDSFIHLLRIDPRSQQIILPKPFTDKMIEILGEKDFNTLTEYYL